MRLILASASPRRAELLRAAGFAFETVVADVDEAVRAGESASAYVRRLAMEKTQAVMALFVGSGLSRTYVGPPQGGPHARGPHAQRESDSPAIFLGADTAVVVDGEILGKPRDDEDGGAMLRRLSGRRHEVMTGVSVRRGDQEVGRVELTVVHVSPLSDEEVAWYVASGEGRDKAGAYAIQGLASRFIPRIDGSYSNVVGLPVACVVELMREITRR